MVSLRTPSDPPTPTSLELGPQTCTTAPGPTVLDASPASPHTIPRLPAQDDVNWKWLNAVLRGNEKERSLNEVRKHILLRRFYCIS